MSKSVHDRARVFPQHEQTHMSTSESVCIFIDVHYNLVCPIRNTQLIEARR